MILKKIRGIIAVIQFLITISVVIIIMFPLKSKNHYIRKKWAALQMLLLGITIEEHGKLDESSDMLILNHQSMVDIILLEHIYNRNIAWVAKKEIGKLPFFGYVLKLPDMIAIDRENKTGIIHLIKEAKKRLKNDRPVAIFPEGTRSDGKKMLKFKSGAKIVAEKLELKVQPMVILNSRDIFDSQNINATPGTIKIFYLGTVQAKKGSDWYKDTEANMREIFKKEMNK